MDIKRELKDLILRSYMIALKHNLITREQYARHVRELSDIDKYNDEQLARVIREYSERQRERTN